jgi:hypothetical protein
MTPVTADGTALGCVVPRRPCAVEYWAAAAGNSAFASQGGFAGAVLDAGFGSGENGAPPWFATIKRV